MTFAPSRGYRIIAKPAATPPAAALRLAFGTPLELADRGSRRTSAWLMRRISDGLGSLAVCVVLSTWYSERCSTRRRATWPAPVRSGSYFALRTATQCNVLRTKDSRGVGISCPVLGTKGSFSVRGASNSALRRRQSLACRESVARLDKRGFETGPAGAAVPAVLTVAASCGTYLQLRRRPTR